MSRYIDADALIKEIKLDIVDDGLTERMVFYRINEAPSIDIVRCRECKYFIDNLTDELYVSTQTETQNSNLTFEKDECAKEYEELGLKELKELINADRKTENCSEIPNNCEDEPTTQMKTQNSNLTFEKRTMLDCYNCKRFETEDECIECRYEPNTEPNCSEKPNNCEPQTERSE